MRSVRELRRLRELRGCAERDDMLSLRSQKVSWSSLDDLLELGISETRLDNRYY